MKAITRRKIEMGRRALKFGREHPDESLGYAQALTRLESLMTRAAVLAEQQREGISRVRSATTQKRDLRRQIKRDHLDHLEKVAAVAGKEAPDVPQMFVLRPGSNPYLAFRTAAWGLLAEAKGRKELLVKHGLTETVLTGLEQALTQFDTAVDLGEGGRTAHVGASADLDTVANEVVQVVNVMSPHNRVRFAHDAELLASWDSASTVFATPRPDIKPSTGGTPPTGGDVRPAA